MTAALTQYEVAVLKVRSCSRTSTAWLQHAMDLPYGLAADFIERMEKAKIITAPNAKGKRVVNNPIKKPKPTYSAVQLLGSG